MTTNQILIFLFVASDLILGRIEGHFQHIENRLRFENQVKVHNTVLQLLKERGCK